MTLFIIFNLHSSKTLTISQLSDKLCGDGGCCLNLLLQAQLSDAQLNFPKCHQGRGHVCVTMLDIQCVLNKCIKNE